jgi:hypothetical protein
MESAKQCSWIASQDHYRIYHSDPRVLSRNDGIDRNGFWINTPAELTRGNHAEFKDELAKLGEGRIFGINGFLNYAQKGGTSESSNCQLADVDDIDFHIGIIRLRVRSKTGERSGWTQDRQPYRK